MKDVGQVALVLLVGMVALVIARLAEEHLAKRAKGSPFGQMFKGGD